MAAGIPLLWIAVALVGIVVAAAVRVTPGVGSWAADVLHRPPPTRYRRGGRIGPVPISFRGEIQLDASLCLACRACAYVCPTLAISFLERPWGHRVAVSMGACLFCGRCQTECPTGAIYLTSGCSLVNEAEQEFTIARDVSFETCTDCGRLMVPVVPYLTQLYPRMPGVLKDAYSRCPGCRARAQGFSILDR
jgi:ferredoxin